jgi:hypothetical protein
MLCRCGGQFGSSMPIRASVTHKTLARRRFILRVLCGEVCRDAKSFITNRLGCQWFSNFPNVSNRILDVLFAEITIDGPTYLIEMQPVIVMAADKNSRPWRPELDIQSHEFVVVTPVNEHHIYLWRDQIAFSGVLTRHFDGCQIGEVAHVLHVFFVLIFFRTSDYPARFRERINRIDMRATGGTDSEGISALPRTDFYNRIHQFGVVMDPLQLIPFHAALDMLTVFHGSTSRNR